MSTTESGEVSTVSFTAEKIIPFSIQVNGMPYHKVIPFEQRIQCWQNAINHLEADVNNAAVNGRHQVFEEYHWSYTNDNHRNDGVLGTIYLYYVAEILKLMKKQKHFNLISSEVSIPWAFRRFLKTALDLRVNTLRQKSVDWQNRGGLKAFVKVFMLIFNKNIFSPVVKNFSKGKVLVASSRNRFSNRYDHVARNWGNDVVLYHKKVEQQLRVKGYESVNALGLLSPRLIFKANVDSWKILKALRTSFNQASLFSHFVHRQNYFQILFLRLRQLLIHKLFHKLEPSQLFYSGSVSDPDQKLTVLAANRLRIPVTVVACRPGLSAFRPEDRIIAAELSNADHLPASYIVKDGFSKKTLVDFGFHPEKITTVSHDLDDVNNIVSFDECLVILFTQYDVNTELVRLVATAKPSGFKKVLLRSHPNRRSIHAIDEKQQAFIKQFGVTVEDITDYSWGQLVFKNCIAIGANSTSMLEAASRGCGLLWLPFLTDLSLQYYPLMQRLGKIAMSEEDFSTQLKALNQEAFRTDVAMDCVQAYQTYFS